MNACRSACGPTGLVIPARRARDPAGNPGGAVPVQPLSVWGEEYWPFHAFSDGQVDRSRGAWRERDGDHLAALTGDHQGPVSALDAEGFNVGASGF